MLTALVVLLAFLTGVAVGVLLLGTAIAMTRSDQEGRR